MLGRLPLRLTVLMWVGQKVVEEGRERWARLTPDEQRALPHLLKTSRGLPSNLAPADEAELRRIVGKALGRA